MVQYIDNFSQYFEFFMNNHILDNLYVNISVILSKHSLKIVKAWGCFSYVYIPMGIFNYFFLQKSFGNKNYEKSSVYSSLDCNFFNSQTLFLTSCGFSLWNFPQRNDDSSTAGKKLAWWKKNYKRVRNNENWPFFSFTASILEKILDSKRNFLQHFPSRKVALKICSLVIRESGKKILLLSSASHIFHVLALGKMGEKR